LTSLALGNNAIVDLTPLAGLTELVTLELSLNQVADLTPLISLTRIASLGLANNAITNLTPLVDSPGLDAGDTVDLSNLPFDCVTEKPKLDALTNRGVSVYLDVPCP